ncbi:MAG: signal peptidase II [Clostridia bacterium]|nr:signal peptidase II [Clostridia bacterium]
MKKWYWLAVLTVIADQLVKALSLRLEQDVLLIPGVLRFTYAENTGMAFSMFSGHTWLLGVVSAACILAGWLILRRYRLGGCSRIAAMLMLGGAAGNMLDRFFRGYVIDMFEVLFVRFAVFNVADAALTVGTVLMAASLLLRPEEWREKHDGSN